MPRSPRSTLSGYRHGGITPITQTQLSILSRHLRRYLNGANDTNRVTLYSYVAYILQSVPSSWEVVNAVARLSHINYFARNYQQQLGHIIDEIIDDLQPDLSDVSGDDEPNQWY